MSALTVVRKIISCFQRLGRDHSGAVTIEVAVLMPIMAVLIFVTFDASTVYTQYDRATKSYYSMGDLVASQTQDLTCSRLDTMAELVYASYAAGNWARNDRASGETFTKDGAPDFRFIVRVITVQNPATETVKGALRGRVVWTYFRTYNDMTSKGEAKPGDLVDIPPGLRVPGVTMVQIHGRMFLSPTFNYLGAFDSSNNNSPVKNRLDMDRYFPMRFVPNLNLIAPAGDPMTAKCSDGSNYP
jgi:Flp pilus assembly pilin Flp